jgi:hypothetical protein
MTVTPYTWNIILAGSWNRAILTPNWIRSKLFVLAENTPITIEVEVDTFGYIRAIHDKAAVLPRRDFLELLTLVPDLASMQVAANYAARALDSLPETPVRAAGVNFRYKIEDCAVQAFELTKAKLDNEISDLAFTIGSRKIARELALDAGGVINFNVELMENEEVHLVVNFHLDSNIPTDIKNWISRTEEFESISMKLLSILTK